eukprot:gene2776-3212_t
MSFVFIRQKTNWSFEHDVMLCWEILVVEPFGAKRGSRERGQAWEKIANNLNSMEHPKFIVDQRAVRDHFLKMERAHKRKMAQEERASGINAENTEVDDAMEKIIWKTQAAEEEQGKVDESKRQNVEMEKETAESVRKRSMERLGETREREKSLEKGEKKQKLGQQFEAIQYLKEKNNKEFELRKKEMDLKERELAIKERKQALREKEYEDRCSEKQGKEERENALVILLQQQLIQQQQIIEEMKKQNELIMNIVQK